MTTLYRLTDTARKVLRQMADADTIEQAGAGYRAADGLVVDLPDSWVEEAPPPLPAEPKPGAYLLGDVIAVREAGPARGSWCVLAATEARYQNLIGVPRRSDWAGVWGAFGDADVPIVPLLPAPATVDTGSKVWACPECTYRIADGPVPDGEPPTFELIAEHEREHRDQDGPWPYPGDEVAKRRSRHLTTPGGQEWHLVGCGQPDDVHAIAVWPVTAQPSRPLSGPIGGRHIDGAVS